jgi:hypothetical protein
MNYPLVKAAGEVFLASLWELSQNLRGHAEESDGNFDMN